MRGVPQSPRAALLLAPVLIVGALNCGFWDELLRSLGMPLDDTCLGPRTGEKLRNGGIGTRTFFVQRKRSGSLQLQDVSDLCRVMMSFGAEDNATVREQLNLVIDEACIPVKRAMLASTPIIRTNKNREPYTRTGTTCVK